RQAQSRVKALERMEKLAPVLTASDFQFTFPEPASLPNPMLSLKELACGYHRDGQEPLTIVSGINRSVLPGQRIGILGANGQGKSTVVKTLAHMNKLVSGEITEGKGLSIGYFAQQELDVLRMDEGPMQHMIRLAREVGPSGREQELRDFLGRFQFTGDMVNQPVSQFSGGEKARLVLALVVWQRPNLLLLDEPTNHLDLTTREALSMALNEFEGTVMLVSHDRALLREVCDEFWLVAKGEVSSFDGDLDDYQRWLQTQAKEVAQAARAARDAEKSNPAAPVAAPVVEVQAAPAPAPAPAPANREDRKAQAQARQRLAEQAKPLKAELKKVDDRMAILSAEQAQINEQQLDAKLTGAQHAELGKRLKALTDEMETLEARWLELTEAIEQLGSAN
ncbi:MAG TPA: ATP-binding cassette domain-containing protein, partial [Aquabacterium sp.]|nr:ATP-binding cassette domain-containing protein [Aquabacterium sp.]